MREHIYSLIDPAGVEKVLDVGCGNGHDLLRLGERLSSLTRLVGLDISEKSIEVAKEAAPANGIYDFLAHDTNHGLPFPDGSFDLVFSLNFLECVADKQALIREMQRILGKNGQIVCAHFDWDTQVFDGVDKALVRKIVHAYADWQQAWMATADGWMGRRLWREFQRSGLFEGRIETYTLSNTEYAEPYYGHRNVQAFEGLARRGMILENEYAAFRQEIDQLAERNEYLYSINMYIYTGRKVYSMEVIEGGVVAPKGFKAAGVHSGIKRRRNDIALIVSDVDSAAAGVFTTNTVKAHCVLSNQEHLKDGLARAIVANSGNANACNGEQGWKDAGRMVDLAAEAVGAPHRRVLSASTGVIGVPLPMDKIKTGISSAAAILHSGSADDAAEGIMTTDTYAKQFAVEFAMSGGKVGRIGAMAKGSGMIAPNMATMLAFITTDVAIDQPLLQAMLSRCVWYTFNSITVDSDTSTNDMVLILANGLASNTKIEKPETKDAASFETALYNVCLHLAKEIARDGEGATKLVEVVVKGIAPPANLTEAYEARGMALTSEQRAGFARSIAKSIANSPLVKTALFGNDPNWGRILMAAGKTGIAFDPNTLEITLAGHKVYANGQPTQFNGYLVSEAMKAKEVNITVDFHQEGGEDATVYTCDFSYDYVKINAEYHT